MRYVWIVFLMFMGCTSSGGGCSGEVGSSLPPDAKEAYIQKRCMAGECFATVVRCIEARTPDPYKRGAVMADKRCGWFISSYEDSPCRSKCGTCSEGPEGDARMLRMVTIALGCQHY